MSAQRTRILSSTAHAGQELLTPRAAATAMPVTLGESHAETLALHTPTEQENHMTAVLDILRKSGAVSVGSLAQASTVTFTHRVYNALNSDQYNSAVVFTAEAQQLADALSSELSEAEVTDVSVLVCTEPISKGKNKGGSKTVKTIVAGLERRNSRNSDALDDTFGAIDIPADGGIYNASGDLVGFTVEAV